MLDADPEVLGLLKKVPDAGRRPIAVRAVLYDYKFADDGEAVWTRKRIGTYLPHRPGTQPFTDRHRSRSNGYPWLVSLLTCVHVGYHHEHHLNPNVPWWRLPHVRNQLNAVQTGR